jgi:RHS repeat-associated protein
VLNNGQSYAYEAFRRTLTDTLYFYHADHLGTPIAMTNTSGALVWRAEHTPFGGIYALTVGTTANNLRFPGQYLDGETGLSQNLWRDYQAKLGRYAEPDPVGRQDAPNPFPYAGNSPTIVIDPMGLKTFMCMKPLDALGGTGRRSGPDIWGNPFYHQYICVASSNGTIVCGGQDRVGKPSWRTL